MIQLVNWPYIKTAGLSGELQTDIMNLLTANSKQETAAHCLAVAQKSREIAEFYSLDPVVASTVALLHDVSNIMQPQDMLKYAVDHRWEIDPAEAKHPFLLHQRLSAELAQDYFRFDNPIGLSAIACHTTLKANPSAYDMTLFLADKLAWDQAGIPPFRDLVMSALQHSLACASLTYINYVLENKMILTPHQWLRDAQQWLESCVQAGQGGKQR